MAVSTLEAKAHELLSHLDAILAGVLVCAERLWSRGGAPKTAPNWRKTGAHRRSSAA